MLGNVKVLQPNATVLQTKRRATTLLDSNKLQTERKQIRPCVRGNTGINRRCRKQKSRAINPALRHAHGMAGVLKPLGEHSRKLCQLVP